MRVTILFLIIAGFALGEVQVWKQNQQFVYGIYTRTLTALPDLKEQYVGVITKGELILQVKSQNQIVGTLANYVYAHFHDILKKGVDTEIPDDILNYQPSELNNKQFIIELNNGLIQSVLVDQSWTNDQLNQLKGILSQIQIDINGKNLIQSRTNQLPQPQIGRPKGLFKVMEPTVTGFCETVYDVNPVQDFQIVHTSPGWIHYRNIDVFAQINQYNIQNQQLWQGQQQIRQEQGYNQQQSWLRQNPYQTQQQVYQSQSRESDEQVLKNQFGSTLWQLQQQQQQPRQEQLPYNQKVYQSQSSESNEQVQKQYYQPNIVRQQQQLQQPWQGVQQSGEQEFYTQQPVFREQQYPEQLQVQTEQQQVFGNYGAGEGSFFEIVKTINYNNCVQQRGYNFGIKGLINLKPLTNKVGDLLSKSTVTKIIAYGTWNNFVVTDATTTNRISVSPDLYQVQKAQVVSQVQLRLLKIQDIKTNLPELQQIINAGNLVYSYNLSSDKLNKIRIHNVQSQDQFQPIRNVQQQQFMPFQSQETPSQVEPLSSEETGHINVQSIKFSANQPKPNLLNAPEIPFYHYNVGNKGRGIQVDPKINVEIEVTKLVNEIGQDVLIQDEIVNRNTLEKFDILVDLIRVLNQQQIFNIQKQLGVITGNVEPSLVGLIRTKVFHDAVAQSGTGPAVSAVCKWIIDRHVKGIEARDLIEDTCRNVQTPVEEVIRVIFNLVRNDEVRRQKQLYSTVLLSFTNLLRHSQVNKVDEHNRFPVYVFGPFHQQLEQIVVNEVIPYLTQRLYSAISLKDDQSTLLYLRALGNIAHPQILNVYEQLIETGAKLTQFQRTALVLSLNKLANVHPNLTRQVLYNIFVNVGEVPQTRSMAVLLLMRCNPSVQMLERLAQSTHDDPSDAVRSIVKSAIVTCSQLTGRSHQNLKSNCNAVKHFLTQRNFGNLYSKTYIRDYVGKEMNLIYNHQLTHIIGEDNITPQITHFEAFENLGGFKQSVAELQAMVSTVEELVKLLPNCKKGYCLKQTTYYQQQQQQGEQEQYLLQSAPQTIQQQQQQQQFEQVDITQQLNIEQEVAKRLEGQLYVNFLGRNGYYAFDEKTLRQLPQILTSSFSLFKEGEKLSYNKLYLRQQVVIAFPLATGYPFIYTLRQPHLLQAIGQLQIKTVPDLSQQPSLETIQNIETLTVNSNVHFVYSVNQIAKTGFITPFDGQRYVAGHVRKVHTHLPLSIKVDIDLRTRNINLKVTPIETKKDFYVIQSGAWPFTLRKDVFDVRPAAEAKDLKEVESRKSQEYNKILGNKTTGMVFNLQCKHQFKGVHNEQIEKSMWRQGILSLINVPLSYHNLWQKIMQNEGQSLLSLLPFSFQQRLNRNFFNHVVSNLLVLPVVDEVNTHDFVKMEGLSSFYTLPFADKHTLEETIKNEDILALGGWPWPLKSLDHYQYNLKYDAVRSVNQIIKLSLKFDSVRNVGELGRTVSNRVQGPLTVDEEKLAYTNIVTADSEQRRGQFLQNAASGIKQASVAVLDASLVFDGQNRAEYVVTMAHGESPIDEKDRLLIFINSNGVRKSENKQLCASYVGSFPQTPVLNFEQALQHNAKSSAKIQIAYGTNCQTTKTHVLVNVNLEQSPEYKELVRNSGVGQRCLIEQRRGNKQLSGCLDATYQANLLDTITINVDLQNPTQKINDIIHTSLNTLRSVAIGNLQHETVNESPNNNKILASLKFKPIVNNEDEQINGETVGMDNVDIMLDSGDIQQYFANVHINNILRPVLSVHPTLNVEDRLIRNALRNNHICTVDQNKILTFDNNVIDHHIGKCWYAMVHHTKMQSRLGKLNLKDEVVQQRHVSVLVRQAMNVNQKEVMIVVRSSTGNEHVVHLLPVGTTVQIKVDGQIQNILSNQNVDVYDEQQNKVVQKPLICVQKLLGNEVKIEVRGTQMRIYYDGVRVQVQVDPSVYRKNVQGICGAFTGERAHDLVTPKQCVVHNPLLFISAWTVTQENKCGMEVQQAKSVLNQIKCNKVRYSVGKITPKLNTSQYTREYVPVQKSVEQSGDQSYVQQQRQAVFSTQQYISGENPQNSQEQTLRTVPQEVRQLGIRQSNQQQRSEEVQTSQQLLDSNVSQELKSIKNNQCVPKRQILYIEENNQVCFSKHLWNICPTGCKQVQSNNVNIDVHCRDSNDPVTKMWLQQIRKGENPDLTTKIVTKTVKYNVPTICVY